MSKNTKQQKKDQEIQVKSQEILAKIEADRAAGNLAPAEDPRVEIRAAKEKLNESYKKMVDMQKQKQQTAKRTDPSTHTYSAEEKQRILERAKKATERYTKLRDFVERYERMQKINKLEEMMQEMREQEQNAAVEAAKKDEE